MSDHDWQPIPSWPGRYRCTCHGILGYRGIAVNPPDPTSKSPYQSQRTLHSIIPYRCQVKGCRLGAVIRHKKFGRGKPIQLCATHRDG